MVQVDAVKLISKATARMSHSCSDCSPDAQTLHRVFFSFSESLDWPCKHAQQEMFVEALATGAALEIKKRNRKTLQYADLGACHRIGDSMCS